MYARTRAAARSNKDANMKISCYEVPKSLEGTPEKAVMRVVSRAIFFQIFEL